jgi:hypothetical protein
MRINPTRHFSNGVAMLMTSFRSLELQKIGGAAIASALAILLTAGCTSHAKPSEIMQKAPAHAGTPPSGKSLVLIYYPTSFLDYSGVWDSTNFLADLGGGHAVAYVCEPGQHYFINRSVEKVGVVEGQLVAGKTYGLYLHSNVGWVSSSVSIEPIKRNTSEWEKAPQWDKDAIWVTRAPSAANHELARRAYIEEILRDFVYGDKKDRVRHLGPEDGR